MNLGWKKTEREKKGVSIFFLCSTGSIMLLGVILWPAHFRIPCVLFGRIWFHQIGGWCVSLGDLLLSELQPIIKGKLPFCLQRI